jgi:hypothetical protein
MMVAVLLAVGVIVVVAFRVPDHQVMGARREGIGSRPLEWIFRLQELGIDFLGPFQVEAPHVQDAVQRDSAVPGPADGGDGVDAADSRLERVEVPRGDEVGLVEEDDVGKRDLLHRLITGVEVRPDVLCIHDRHDGVEPEVAAHLVVGEEGLGNRGRVREAGRLDQDTVEAVLALEEPSEDPDQVPAHRAADAAVVHLKELLVPLDHELVVHADLAELVLDHGQLAAMLLGEDPVEERGLAGAKKACEDGDGYRVGGHGVRSFATRK